MEIIEKVIFVGQGYVIEEGTVVDVVATRPDLGTVMVAKDGHLIGVFPDNHIERFVENHV